jgi:hypothetical protein
MRDYIAMRNSYSWIPVVGVSIATVCVAVLFNGWPGGQAYAAPPDRADWLEWPKEANLTIRPTPLPQPALKYRLLPPVREQTIGNAATVCLMAFADGAQVDFDEVERYLTLPLDQSTREHAQDYVGRYKEALGHLDAAARRSYCQWQDPFREEGGYETRIRYNRNGRLLGRLLALRARLEIASHDYDAALRTLQTGFALARFYTRDGNWLLLKGATDPDGIIKALLDRLREWVQAEGSSNLYWALANLPCPMVERRHAIEVEDAALYWSFPELRHVDQLTEDQAQRTLERIWHVLGKKTEGPTARQASGEVVARLLPRARRWLIESGRKRELVEVMPASVAVLLYQVDEYRCAADDLFKWAGLSYPQTIEGLGGSMLRFDRLRKEAPDNLLLFTMVAVSGQFRLCAIMDRELALLECIEGLRAYGAAHEGRLPKSLDDLYPDTPAPLDPLLGRRFDYHTDGHNATISAAVSLAVSAGAERVYKITLKR